MENPTSASRALQSLAEHNRRVHDALSVERNTIEVAPMSPLYWRIC